ncbi:MAG: hypothetical protein RRA15_12335 [bacterium]|nr:hypothetical protein [bacterium]
MSAVLSIDRISMRYAQNLSEGNGLVWNPGDKVEGITNLLMTFFMAASQFILGGRASILFLQISGIFLILTNALVIMKISRFIFHNDKSMTNETHATTAFALGILFYPLNYWALMGMETGLLALLVSCLYFTVLKNVEKAEISWPFIWLIILSFLTRPDAPAILIPAIIYREYHLIKISKRTIPAIELTTVATLMAMIFLARYTYYGEIVPNTYILKVTGMPLLDRISNGANFTKPFIISFSLPIILATINIIRSYSKEKLILFAAFFCAVLYQIWVGGDAWDYWRFVSPAVPLLLLLTIRPLMRFSGKIPQSQIEPNTWYNKVGFTRTVFVSLLLFLVFIPSNFQFRKQISFNKKPFQTKSNRINYDTALILKYICSDKATVGVFWAGTIPYVSGLTAYDMLGKNDKYIARLSPDPQVAWANMKGVPGHNKYDLEYSIKGKQPTYVQDYKWWKQNMYDYVMANYIIVQEGDLEMYLRKDSDEVRWERLRIVSKGRYTVIW